MVNFPNEQPLTIEDLIIKRITHRGMTAEGYKAFLKVKNLPERIVQKILAGLTLTTTNADAGIPKSGISHLLNSLNKMEKTIAPGRNIPMSRLPISEWASIKNVKYLIDNRIISGPMYKGYIDPIIHETIKVKPISRLISTNKEYGKTIGGAGERVTPVTVPDDIYATQDAHVKNYSRGSIDRVTARLIWMTGDRGGEMGRLTLNSFSDPENPTYKTSLTATKLLKQAKFKGQLSYFTQTQAYYILRARQIAISSGQALDAPLFPNLETINKNIGTYLKNTYSDADASAFTEYTEKEGRYRNLQPRRVFARNLMKDIVGSLYAIDKLRPGSDNFQIAQNAITNTEITTGIRGPVSNIKYMIADGSVRLIINPAMNAMDDGYTAYSGYNSIQSMLAEDGVINEVRNANGKVIHNATEVKKIHTQLIPLEHTPLRYSYAMGWMAPEALTQWEEIHSKSFRSILKDHTARIQQLDFSNEAFINDSVSKAVKNTQKRLAETAELNNKFIKETNDYNTFLEEEKIKRTTTRIHEGKIDKTILRQEILESNKTSQIDSEQLRDEATQGKDTKPVKNEGESYKDFNERLKSWRKGLTSTLKNLTLKALPFLPLVEAGMYTRTGLKRKTEILSDYAILPHEVPENYYSDKRATELASTEAEKAMFESYYARPPESMLGKKLQFKEEQGSYMSSEETDLLREMEMNFDRERLKEQGIDPKDLQG